MSYKDKYNAYQKANATVSEIQQVIMLYEGAINFIEQAKEAILEKDFERRYNLINKAIAIIGGLNSCLEFNDQTNEVATALDEYYQSLDMRLLFINTNDSIEDCDRVIEDLRTMLNAWKDIADSESDTGDASAEIPIDMPEKTPKTPSTPDLGALQDIELNV